MRNVVAAIAASVVSLATTRAFAQAQWPVNLPESFTLDAPELHPTSPIVRADYTQPGIPPDTDTADVSVVSERSGDVHGRVLVTPGGVRMAVPGRMVLRPGPYTFVFDDGEVRLRELFNVPVGSSTVRVHGFTTGVFAAGMVFMSLAFTAEVCGLTFLVLDGFYADYAAIIGGGVMILGALVAVPGGIFLAFTRGSSMELVPRAPDAVATRRTRPAVRFVGAGFVPLEHGGAVSTALAF